VADPRLHASRSSTKALLSHLTLVELLLTMGHPDRDSNRNNAARLADLGAYGRKHASRGVWRPPVRGAPGCEVQEGIPNPPRGATVGAIAVPRSLSSVESNGRAREANPLDQYGDDAADGAVDCVCLRPRIFERGTEDGGKLNVGSSQVSMNLWRYEEI
jgi:hypothetical protein